MHCIFLFSYILRIFFVYSPIEYEQFLNKSKWPMDGILTGTTTLDYSGPGSNGNEEVFHTPQISRTRASQPDAV